MNALLNNMRLQAERAMNGRATTRVAIVSAYDPNRYAAKVLFQPDNSESGWLPIGAMWVGNGWGLFTPPSIDDMVEVEFQDGDHEAGMIVSRFFNDEDRPLPVPAGECWMVHQSGASFKLTNDGKASINGQLEIDATAPTINLTATTSVNVTAPAINLGASGQSLLSLVTAAFTSLFNGHTHPGDSGGTTGVPNQQMGATHITTTVKGG